MDTLFKTFHADIKASSDARTVKFLISTASVDRDGDTMDPKGWDLAAYKKNPTVLWSHDYSSLPVAKAISIEQTDQGLAAVAEFPAKGIHAFADTVYELLKGGFLGAASVGFRPVEHTKATDRDRGINYSKQELLEWSIVPIPANPEALVQMSLDQPQHKGLLKPLVDWSEKFLGEYYGERGVWLPASQVEKTFEAINKSGVLVKTPNPRKGEDGSSATSSSTGEQKEHEHESVADTLEVDEELVLELAEEVFDVELDQVLAHTREVYGKLFVEMTDEAVTRALNYARGRVC
jgi:HK97 family phage prohead protease